MMAHMRFYLWGRSSASAAPLVMLAWCAIASSGSGCAHAPPAPRPDAPPSLNLVESWIAAFNRADPDAMVALSHPEIEWLSIGPDGVTVTVEAQGHDALHAGMRTYFANIRKPRSVLEGALATGPYVTVQERVHWETKDGEPKSQAALAVYQVEAERIRRVWYFPPEP